MLKSPAFAKPQNVMGNAIMKFKMIFIGLCVFLTSCNSSTETRKSYIESKPSFFELHNGKWLTNKWIRQPENLFRIHETFKKVGYNKILGSLLSDDELIVQDIYIKKRGYQLIDSLILTYKQPDKGTLYFNEFWARRKKERNDSAVFIILKDIQYSYRSKLSSADLQLSANDSEINDTLRQLIEIEFPNDTLTEKTALNDFETLRKLGFHQSAYNLLFETYKYQDIKWDKDSLEKTLKQNDKFIYPWFIDDTK